MSPEKTVRAYLDAMERRDLGAAKSFLAPGFFMVFPGNKRFDALYPKWEKEVRALLAAGADVIVPAGGLPMMLFSGEFEGVPVLNGITLIAKSAELAVKLRKLGMAKVSRRSNFASPPDKALKEFLEP